MSEQKLQIKIYPDAVLRTPGKPVEQITDDVNHLAEQMVETMHAVEGVGLAAPQVGISRQIAVIGSAAVTGEELILINPKIIAAEGELVMEEGCLSLPEIHSEVKRSTRVIVEALDLNGKLIRLEKTDLMSRVIQHEIDHLKGILFIDRLPPLKRALLSSQLKKLQRER